MNVLSVIWALINIASLMVLLRFWLTGFTLIAAQHGRWVTGAVFLFTMSMCVRPATDNQFPKPIFFNFSADKALSTAILASASSSVTLIDLPLTTIDGYWALDNLPADSPRIAFRINQSGLIGYIRWESQAASIHLTPTHQLHYEADGVLIWCLLGIPLYRQGQHFSGEVPLQAKANRPNV